MSETATVTDIAAFEVVEKRGNEEPLYFRNPLTKRMQQCGMKHVRTYRVPLEHIGLVPERKDLVPGAKPDGTAKDLFIARVNDTQMGVMEDGCQIVRVELRRALPF